MENLAENQLQIIAMKQFIVNFKKTGYERRTADYIKRRLETLDAYWQEFQTNHVTLSGFRDESLEYFANKIILLINSRAHKANGYDTVLSLATPLARA